MFFNFGFFLDESGNSPAGGTWRMEMCQEPEIPEREVGGKLHRNRIKAKQKT